MKNSKQDVFRSFLVKNTDYSGYMEMPRLKTSHYIPEKVITFSKAMLKNNRVFDCWIVFYEDDEKFERLWHNPRKYLNKIKKFKGVISPDFSLYRNMPLAMQIWNTYRGRALANWLINNGVEVIPNVRTADERSFDFCFDGIEPNSTVAIGTHGCIKRNNDRFYFEMGLQKLVDNLSPRNLIVYGAAPHSIFQKYKDKGINIISFESEFALSRKQVYC